MNISQNNIEILSYTVSQTNKEKNKVARLSYFCELITEVKLFISYMFIYEKRGYYILGVQ